MKIVGVNFYNYYLFLVPRSRKMNRSLPNFRHLFFFIIEFENRHSIATSTFITKLFSYCVTMCNYSIVIFFFKHYLEFSTNLNNHTFYRIINVSENFPILGTLNTLRYDNNMTCSVYIVRIYPDKLHRLYKINTA